MEKFLNTFLRVCSISIEICHLTFHLWLRLSSVLSAKGTWFLGWALLGLAELELGGGNEVLTCILHFPHFQFSS